MCIRRGLEKALNSVLQKYLSVNPGRVVRQRKIRGKKHFRQRVIRNAKQFIFPSLDELKHAGWHKHAGFAGYGNLNWDFREAFIEAHCIIFKKFAENLHLYSKPFQLYMIIYSGDASPDAVYFNVPDEKDGFKYFPMKHECVEWGVPDLEDFFSKLLAPHKIRCGYQGGEYPVIIIYSPDIGVPIE